MPDFVKHFLTKVYNYLKTRVMTVVFFSPFRIDYLFQIVIIKLWAAIL